MTPAEYLSSYLGQRGDIGVYQDIKHCVRSVECLEYSRTSVDTLVKDFSLTSVMSPKNQEFSSEGRVELIELLVHSILGGTCTDLRRSLVKIIS